jgi:GNAT superfamily N-acetyltransferase
MMRLNIRRAQVEDSEGICRTHRASITELCSSHYSPQQIATWAGDRRPQEYERRIREAIVLVAEEPGEVVGFSIMSPERDEICALYVHPQHVRRGIGRRLLDALEAEARAAGVSEVVLQSTLNAVPFYARCGFTVLGEAMHALPGGAELPCVRMAKKL